jgi:hypothetical protein
MRTFRIIPVLAAAAAAVILAAGAAQANQLAGPVVTGTLTSVQGDSITVNGQTYTIAPGSPAAAELSSLSAGQRVDVQLNGPADSPDTEVTNVTVHQGQ